MACKSETKEFTTKAGEVIVVYVRQLPATKALDLQIELLNVLGTEVFPFISGDYNFNNILRIMAATEHTKLADIMKRVVCMASKDGKEVKPALFDHEYSGELLTVCEVFAFVCEVNFKDFFNQGLEMNERKSLEVDNQSTSEELK